MENTNLKKKSKLWTVRILQTMTLSYYNCYFKPIIKEFGYNLKEQF